MKARDVLDDAHWRWACTAEPGVEPGEEQADALLGTTPDGEGVYIGPDGTLMRVERTTVAETCGFIEDDDVLYRLVPIEGADRD